MIARPVISSREHPVCNVGFIEAEPTADRAGQLQPSVGGCVDDISGAERARRRQLVIREVDRDDALSAQSHRHLSGERDERMLSPLGPQIER
jgi:hypothetical protein